MTPTLPSSVEGVVMVEVLAGQDATPATIPSFLVEVPHGADQRQHFDLLFARMQGNLPTDLHHFFHFNTDVGAWAYGRATAEALLKRHPERSAMMVRSLIPRTLIDCNRPATQAGGDLKSGGVTSGIPSYVRDEGDQALLIELHRRYVEVAEAAYERVVAAGGFALAPHTYGPRSVGIERVDNDIITKLHWACEPERFDNWPLRAEVDLLTRDEDGNLLAPTGQEEALVAGFATIGLTATCNDTYFLHPATLGHTFSARYPGRVLCLEIRRDLLVTWDPFVEMRAKAGVVGEVAQVLSSALSDLFE